MDYAAAEGAVQIEERLDDNDLISRLYECHQGAQNSCCCTGRDRDLSVGIQGLIMNCRIQIGKCDLQTSSSLSSTELVWGNISISSPTNHGWTVLVTIDI